ncbi:MAG TPA: hypothetical protein PLL33_12675 [Paracoccus sp. (in: a-proteobacteria)]|nr:hypothetical protein [Paracoccus sp. (in: a-proteobacteria)]
MKRLWAWLNRLAGRVFTAALGWRGPFGARSAKVFNEHLKQTASFLNSLAVALLGFAVVRPLFEAGQAVSVAYGLLGLAFHGVSHYVISKTKEE